MSSGARRPVGVTGHFSRRAPHVAAEKSWCTTKVTFWTTVLDGVTLPPPISPILTKSVEKSTSSRAPRNLWEVIKYRGAVLSTFIPSSHLTGFGLLQWRFRGDGTVNGEQDIRWLQIYINFSLLLSPTLQGSTCPHE